MVYTRFGLLEVYKNHGKDVACGVRGLSMVYVLFQSFLREHHHHQQESEQKPSRKDLFSSQRGGKKWIGVQQQNKDPVHCVPFNVE